jgi:hypothetical protein
MDLVRWCGRLAALVTIGMLAGMPAAQAAIVKPATPVHTAAPHHRHAAHRHHHRAQRVAFSASPAASHPAAPAPSSPPERTHHRATLPSLVHGTRHVHGSKAGSSRAAVAPATGGLVAVAVHRLEPWQNASPDAREHPVTGGRGPPRGSPTTPSTDPPPPASVHAARPAPPGASAAPQPRASAVADHTSGRLTAARRGRGAVSPDLRARPSARSVFSPRLPLGRLHAVRREGATACLSIPSTGGTPCPA